MRRAALLALALMAGLAAAPLQALGLRSGEHEDKVRLVAEIPVGAGWALGRNAQGYVLRLEDSEARFDVAGVFDRIGRDRILKLTPRPGALQIRLSCDPCHARAFLWRADRLVIDVIDGAAPQGSRFELPIDPPPAPRRDRLLPPVFAMGPAPALPGRRILAPAPPPAPPAPEATTPPTGEDGFETARREMIEGVARAAGQGLLDVAPDTERGLERDWATDPMEAALAPEGPEARPGLSAQSGFDAGLAAAVQTTNDDCPDPGWFDVESWADAQAGFAAGLVARRDAMAGEFGRVSPSAVEALARYYIHHGFGLEARAVLASDGQHSRERVWLGLLAGLVDGPVEDPGPLAETAHCLGPAALWGALARGSLAGMPERARTAAVAAFRRLPEALRGHLGERLAGLFVEAGDARGADEILGRAGAAPTGGTFEAEIAEAGIAGTLQGPEAEIAQLESTAAQDARLTPEGLARLLDLMLEEGRDVPGGLLELARALRFEHRGEEGARALAEVEARALIATGLHEAALDLVETAPFTPAEALALRGAAVIAMTRDLDEAAFLERAFAPMPAPLPPKAEIALARRLLDLGFAEAALARLDRVPEAAERADLRAEAQLALGREEAAPTPRVTDLPVVSADKETPAPDADPVAAWRAQDWDSLAQSGDPLFEAASAAARSPAPVPAETVSLASGRALVEEAQAARDLATDLLARFTLDPPTP